MKMKAAAKAKSRASQDEPTGESAKPSSPEPVREGATTRSPPKPRSPTHAKKPRAVIKPRAMVCTIKSHVCCVWQSGYSIFRKAL